MTAPCAARRRLHIDALELDLRGVSPATAEALARLLGPALARALAQQPYAPLACLDAGRLACAASPDAEALATDIAQRIAGRLREEQP
ncbi:hypothetical protein SAMN05660489_02915 [Pseudomonas sp. LAMO17WK12:I10]|uniref:hypothetical protein n=1 Tax=unclassified Pseudomonas TaxID=196821 RepID=UPI000BC43613|nr:MULTISPECIES: hypothetical protein [unclassified Pseudomonas]PXX69515.1 hypothetical protein H160_03000 [Pseudomonas sp. LAMO17WK12:I9]SNY32968.1 hypothetical protein SAMN05660489_02915 [Pseudomonas sp. LAMO17WK12:I10]